MCSENRVLKVRTFDDYRPMEELDTYVPEEWDVRFTWDRVVAMHGDLDKELNQFFDRWRPEGLVKVLEVAVGQRDLGMDEKFLYLDESFEVARFDNLAGAIHFKLSLD